MLIKCPNCNRDTIYDYKCQYCKYVIKPKDNNYPKDIYEYLKRDYLISRNKAVTIKNGMEKYSKSMKEIKEIVDYIADEIYDMENFKSKEDVEGKNIVKQRRFKITSLILLLITILSSVCLVISVTKYKDKTFSIITSTVFLLSLCLFAFSLRPEKIKKKNTFYYSFIQYFIHDMIYKILLLFILSYIPIFFKINNGLYLIIWYFSLFFLLLYFLFKWGEASTSSITIELNKITFKFKKANPALQGKQLERFYHLSWANYVDYDIQSITNVVENFNSFIIYGVITKNQHYITPGHTKNKYKPKEYKRIIISKRFKNNSKLIKELKKKIR